MEEYFKFPLSEIPVCGKLKYRVTPEQAAIAYLQARLWAKVGMARARAKKYGVENTLTWKQWKPILERSKGVCYYCRQFVGIQNIGIDHVISMSKGGANSVDNIVPSCFPCNAKKKRTRTQENRQTAQGY